MIRSSLLLDLNDGEQTAVEPSHVGGDTIMTGAVGPIVEARSGGAQRLYVDRWVMS